jgi:hypothetical protein
LGPKAQKFFYEIKCIPEKIIQDYVFPLSDLQAVDEYSPNSQPIMDYSTWFANRLE